ncbi:DUF4251 domain-containing protein [Flammeovirgaceae bacterium SG7u.111]|nr:DUF4251 domain-containing protein [Flammeovirgaceae bacterium SG7u.132]WPO38175.1 DUF4251 domain-containing protein [Flammeovirgaceae bacterium SG7u.111]
MKKLILSLLVLFQLSAVAVFAQENKEEKKLTKKEKKELKMRERLEQKEVLLAIINEGRFVIETHTVYDRYGQSYNMNPNINFVAIDKDKSTIQLAFNHLVGWNGVGGITLDGTVTKLEINEGKNNKAIQVQMRVSNRGTGWADINISVSNDGYARAYIRGDFGERITFSGQLVSLEESSVYKGMPLF